MSAAAEPADMQEKVLCLQDFAFIDVMIYQNVFSVSVHMSSMSWFKTFIYFFTFGC